VRFLQIGTSVISPTGGPFRWIRFDVLRWRLMISLRKRGAKFGSSVGSALAQNNGGYLVKDDRPLLMTSAPTVAVPPLEWTSPSGRARQTSSRPRGGA